MPPPELEGAFVHDGQRHVAEGLAVIPQKQREIVRNRLRSLAATQQLVGQLAHGASR